VLKYGTTKKSNAQITLEQCTITTNCSYMHWNVYATDAHTLLLHVLALFECHHQGIFAAVVLKK
jgi:hypothetical protein